MAPPRINIDFPQSLTASALGKEDFLVRSPKTTTSGSSSVPDANALGSTVTKPPSTQSPDAAPTEASCEIAVADNAAASNTSSRKRTFDGAESIVGLDLAGLSKRQMRKRLPPGWCMNCLACHPFPDDVGSYHIRSGQENTAMHEAIRVGRLPPVDPWQGVVDAFLAPQPAPLHPQDTVTSQAAKTFVDGDGMYDEAIKGLSTEESIEVLCEFLDREDRATERRKDTAARSAPSFGSYSNAVTTGRFMYPLPGAQRMQPTGPPRKERKHRASDDDQHRYQRTAHPAGSDQSNHSGGTDDQLDRSRPPPRCAREQHIVQGTRKG